MPVLAAVLWITTAGFLLAAALVGVLRSLAGRELDSKIRGRAGLEPRATPWRTAAIRPIRDAA